MAEKLNGWHQDDADWPNPYDMVWEDWFRVEIHSMVYDGGDCALRVDRDDDLEARWSKTMGGK